MGLTKGRGIFSWLLDFVIVFLFVYGITFKITGFAGSKLVVVYLLLVLNKRKVLHELLNDRFVKYTFLSWVFISVYYYGVTVFLGKYSWVFLYQRFLFFFECIVGAYLLVFYLYRKYSIQQIYAILICVFFLQSLFIFISFISDSFRTFTNNIMVVEDERALTATRTRGFSTSANAALSYLQSLGVFISASYLLVFRREQRSRISSIVAISSIVIIPLSTIFVARTGLLFASLFAISYSIQYIIRNRSFGKVVAYVTLLSFVIIFIVNNYRLLIPQDKIYLLENRVLNRAFEAMESYNEQGKIETNSTNTLMDDMFFFPDDDLTLLFGEGVWDASRVDRGGMGRKVTSDVGVIRLIFAGGVLLALMFYCQFYVYFKQFLKTRVSTEFKYGVICLIAVVIVGELKEPFIVAASGIAKTLFLVLFINRVNIKRFTAPN
ncbi:hypothetical protein [Olivibacter jilunii]|uniref:hypothetical protein n=1 Tax=Olivibacter jilunii TaxID=985016 RepID=UPI003F1517C8